jgi:hypothetical protein
MKHIDRQRLNQKGSILIGVLLLLALSLVVIPQLMDLNLMAQKSNAKQSVNINLLATANNTNGRYHSAITQDSTNLNAMFKLLSTQSCDNPENDPCLKRLKAVNMCPSVRFVPDTALEPLVVLDDNQMITSLICRTSSSDASMPIGCDVNFSNLKNTASVRLFTCVKSSSNSMADVGIAVWSYIESNGKYYKVQEDSY